MKQFARALILLKEIVRDYPRFPLAQFTWGCSTTNRAGSRTRGPRTPPRSRPTRGHFKARFNLGKVLFQLGNDAAALGEMREVVKLAPNLPQGYLFEARGLLKTNAPIDEVQALSRKGSPSPRPRT